MPESLDYNLLRDRLRRDVAAKVEDSMKNFEAKFRKELDTTIDSVSIKDSNWLP